MLSSPGWKLILVTNHQVSLQRPTANPCSAQPMTIPATLNGCAQPQSIPAAPNHQVSLQCPPPSISAVSNRRGSLFLARKALLVHQFQWPVSVKAEQQFVIAALMHSCPLVLLVVGVLVKYFRQLRRAVEMNIGGVTAVIVVEPRPPLVSARTRSWKQQQLCPNQKPQSWTARGPHFGSAFFRIEHRAQGLLEIQASEQLSQNLVNNVAIIWPLACLNEHSCCCLAAIHARI